MIAVLSEAPEVRLTPRERELVALIVDEHSNKAIATLMRLSLNTVESYIENVARRLPTDPRPAKARIRFFFRGVI